MSKLVIQTYISELQLKQSERTQITADMVLSELAAIAFSDRTSIAKVVHKQGTDEETGVPYEYADVALAETDKLSDNVKKAISGIKCRKNGVEVSSYDKLKALELIGKHLGMFEQKSDIAAESDCTSDPLSESLKNLAEEMNNDK